MLYCSNTIVVDGYQVANRTGDRCYLLHMGAHAGGRLGGHKVVTQRGGARRPLRISCWRADLHCWGCDICAARSGSNPELSQSLQKLIRRVDWSCGPDPIDIRSGSCLIRRKADMACRLKIWPTPDLDQIQKLQ